jgi:hypothetical protein
VTAMRSLAAVLLLTLGACATEQPPAGAGPGAAGEQPDAAPAPGGEPIRTSAAEYTMTRGSQGYEVRIPFVFTNRTSDTVYVVNCNGATALELQREQNGAWTTVWSPVLPACLSEPIRIAGGAEYAGTVDVWAGDRDSDTYPQFDVDDLDGEYRIRWGGVHSSYDPDGSPFGIDVPEAQRVSNTFRLRLP